MVIRRVNPWSLARVFGMLQACMGLVVGLMFSVVSLVIGVGIGQADADLHALPFGGAAMGALFGIGAAIFLPIVYGVIGFVTGALGALIYNLVAGAIGGIEIDVDESRTPPVG
jgi:hypothetical protein